MTNDVPNKETRNMAVFIKELAGADRVVVETKNALGAIDAHYLYAPDILKSFNTRADQAQAELQAAVAAEREACAQEVDEYKMRADGRAKVSRSVGKHEAADRHEGQSGAAVSIAAAIRANTPEDAQAALEAVKREARNEARREAEAAISKLRMQNQDIVSQWNGAIDQASDAILALMEDTDDD